MSQLNSSGDPNVVPAPVDFQATESAAPAAPAAPVNKPGFNIYSMMLIIAFLCLTVANTLLYLELRRWGTNTWRWWDTSQATSGEQTYVVPETDNPEYYV